MKNNTCFSVLVILLLSNAMYSDNFEKSYGCSKLVKKSKNQGNRGIHNPFTKESNQKLSQIRKTVENP